MSELEVPGDGAPDETPTREAPTTPGGAADHRSRHFSHPQQVGPYSIREVLGEGGMGAVYLAWQNEPVQREVALKLIKLGMDTREIVARFDAELQTLAVMSHPNIAQVYDAGATDSGRPYFVMEYVPGVAIDKHCDRHRLSIDERLRLFQQVCEGVQHAHQKGIVHRDLKPSNVLVTAEESTSLPKIIDFGIAKATGPNTELGVTEQGVVVGTPEYMSPEQAAGLVNQIDTRSDIYSLGVLLYELLVGVVPFEPGALRDLGPVEMRDLILEKDPPRPSVRLTGMEDPDRVSGRRSLDVTSLVRVLRADLDWITLKALEKDPERRYASALEFSADIQRYLTDESVLASPPTLGYRLTKFVRRNKVPVAAVATILVTLVLALVFTLRSYGTVEDAREAEHTARTKLEDTLDEARRSLAALFLEKSDRAIEEKNFRAAALHAAASIAEHESGEGRTALHAAWSRMQRLIWSSEEMVSEFRSSPNGRYLALVQRAARGARITICERDTGRELLRRDVAGQFAFALSDAALFILDHDPSGWGLSGWQLRDGQPIGESARDDHGASKTAAWLSVTGDGSRVIGKVTSRRASQTLIWDADTIDLLARIDGVESDARSVSRDGRFLGCARGDTVEVHDVRDGMRAWSGELTAATGMIRFSEDGSLIAAVARGGRIRVWEHGVNEIRHTFADEFSGRVNIYMSGQSLYACADRRVVRWSIAHGGVLQSLDASEDHDLSVDPAGRFGAWYGHGGQIRLIELATGRIAWQHGMPSSIRDVKFDSNGGRIGIARDDSFEIRSVDTGLVRFRLELPGASSYDLGQHSMVTLRDSAGGGRVEVWSLGKGADGERVAAAAGTRDLLIVPGGSLACTATQQGIVLWELPEWRPLKVLEGHGRPVYCLAASRDGRFLASGSSDNTVRVWDLDLEQQVRQLSIESNPVHALAFSPDGERLAVGYGVDRMAVFDVTDAGAVREFVGHSAQVYSLDFDEGGEVLASASQDGTVRSWNSVSGEVIEVLERHEAGVTRVALSDAGSVLVSTDQDGWLVISRDGAVAAKVQAHGTEITDLVVTDSLVVTAASDGTVRLWDLESGSSRGLATRHTRPVTCVAISPEGDRVASSDGSSLRWTSLEVFLMPRTAILERVRQATGQ